MPNTTHIPVQDAPQDIRSSIRTTCCIVGGGPAGAMLALLLTRQGVEVILLEAHGDFDRQFRGDSLYPTVLEIMNELGLSERLHALPHTKMTRIPIKTPEGEVVPIDMNLLHSPYPYIMMVPQVSFLESITDEASHYPTFRLIMSASVRQLIEEDGRVCGIRYRANDGWHEIRAALTIGADGRFSKVRSLAHIPLLSTPVPIDTVWFRVPRQEDDPETSFGRAGKDYLGAMLMRTDHWQVAFNIPKGSYPTLKAQGLPSFRQTIAQIIPEITERLEHIHDWTQMSPLSVEAGRVRQWYRPGLLLIGDAAHVMSPALGVGVNFAIQDAVVAANVLTKRLLAWQQHGTPLLKRYLAEVQMRRELPTRLMQTIQNSEGNTINDAFVRKLFTLTFTRRLITRIAAIGLWRIHVRYRSAMNKIA